MKKELAVRGKHIRIKEINGQEMFSLTDIANRFGEGRSERILFRWFKNQSTLDFLEAYDEEYNPNFKDTQMGAFKTEAMKNSNTYTLSDYQAITGSPFVNVTKGRYGGTWAVFDIAAELMMWINARFKVWFIADYKRMKINELQSDTQARLWRSQKKIDGLMEVLRFEQDELRMLKEQKESQQLPLPEKDEK